MFWNYLKIAWRQLFSNRFYSLVNIAGLTAGLAFALVIGAYVWTERQVNSDLKDLDNQYILQSRWKDPGMGIALTTLGPLAKALKEQYPGLVANYYRFDGIATNVSQGRRHFREGLQIGDSTLLNMYGFQLLYGDAGTALDDPFSVVISRAAALKYFGRPDATGRTLSIENMSGNRHDFMVSGVLRNPPRNSVTWLNDANHAQIFLSVEAMPFFGRDMSPWQNRYIVGFLRLRPGVTPADLAGPIKALVNANATPEIRDNLTVSLEPLRTYYLGADNGLVRKMTYALSLIALFILLMAMVNFINMSVGRAGSRAKEMGIRKLAGGRRGQLVLQYLAESVLLTLIAGGIAVLLYAVTRAYFSEVLGTALPTLAHIPFAGLLLLALLTITTGILAGLYPAFVLSSMTSADCLKGGLVSVKERTGMRKALVGFQFLTAAMALAAVVVVTSQINFFLGGSLGYNKNRLLTAQVPRDWSPAGIHHIEGIRQQFAAMPQVSEASISYEIPDGNSNGANSQVFPLGKDSAAGTVMQSLITDEYYAATYEIPMAAGHFLRTGAGAIRPTDIAVNEAAAHALGWTPEEAVGRQVRIAGRPSVFTITGVTRNFHFGTMHERIRPVWFSHVQQAGIYRYLTFRIRPGDMSRTLKALEAQWSRLMPGEAFAYQFMDEGLRHLYDTELRLRKAGYAAAALALTIVLLGILGLMSLSIQRRTKEIGIRKVLGSSARGIIFLFLKEFLSVMLVAGIVAASLGYLLMQRWLDGYAYHITLTAEPFILSIAAMGCITGLLIALQSAGVALSNPVKSLRTE